MQVHIFISLILMFLFLKIVFGLTISGQENIPRKGGVIIAPNHTSNWDPPVIAVSIALKREVFFLAKEELFWVNKFYALLLKKYNAFPIRKSGIDKKTIRVASFLLQKGKTIIVFPEGKRNLGNGFLSPQPGVGYLAIKNKVPIIPVYMSGTTEKMINLLFRKKRVKVIFGKKIDTANFVSNHSLLKDSKKVTDFVMNRIRSLKTNA